MSKLKKIMGRGAVIIVLFIAIITIYQPTPVLSQYSPITQLAGGSTPAGNTAWQQSPGGQGVFVDVDTSSVGFTSTPIYITSLGGTLNHSGATGATSIYSPTPTRFRVYVRYATGGSLTPAMANQNGWHINWIGSVGGVHVSHTPW
jgi:hypothetical protein